MLTCTLLILACVFIVGQADDCRKIDRAMAWASGLAMPLNSFLFFFRVRAVLYDSKIFGIMFGLLWLSTFSCLADLFSSQAEHLGTTKVCIYTVYKDTMSFGMIAVAVYDTLVYVTISAKLTAIGLDLSPNPSSRFGRLTAFVTGKGLGHMAKTLLISGQTYYVTTVGVNILSMSAGLHPSFPLPYKAMLAIVNVAIQNSMACRVHRQLKLGLIVKYPVAKPTRTTSAVLPSVRPRAAYPSLSEFSLQMMQVRDAPSE